MKIWEAEGKNVKIRLKNGSVYSGLAYDFTAAIDNTPEIASITIGHTELFENEIETIKMI